MTQRQIDTFVAAMQPGKDKPYIPVSMPEACTIQGHERPVYPRVLYLVPGPGGREQKVCPPHYRELLDGKVMVPA
jgi:hypothetical protein